MDDIGTLMHCNNVKLYHYDDTEFGNNHLAKIMMEMIIWKYWFNII